MILINNFTSESGFHSVSCSIRRALSYYDIDISELMIFGLASALYFFYFDSERYSYPLIGGRVRRAEFEDNFMLASGVAIDSIETASRKRAYSALYDGIYRGDPCLVYVDVGLLPYARLPEMAHFGGHAIVVYGLDEERGVAYVTDGIWNDETREPINALPLGILADARAAKSLPFPPSNRLVKFSPGRYSGIAAGSVQKAIKKNSRAMLAPPNQRVGLSAIKAFASKVAAWGSFSDETLREVAFMTRLMINTPDCSGGGCFRAKYGEFLTIAADMLGSRELKCCGKRYAEAASLWDEVCELLLQIYQGLNRNNLLTISSILHQLHNLETEIQTSIFDIVGADD